MKIKLLGIVAILSGLTVVACGDDSGTGGSGTTTSTTSTGGTSTKSTGTGTTTGTTSGTTTGGGMCALPDTTDPADCAEACSDVYDCGALTCMGNDLCMFSGDAAEKTAFVGDAMSGCIEGCMGQPALIAIVDPADCATTISTLKTLNPAFADACDNGIGAGGGGGN